MKAHSTSPGSVDVSEEEAARQSAAVFSTLRRFARPRPPRERCDLCAAEIGEPHQHLFSPAERQLVCACDACAILFSGNQNGRYRVVPRRGEFWPDFQIDDIEWQALNIPINLAFFTMSSLDNEVHAFYPSPAGATESHVSMDAWQTLAAANARLKMLQTDVEALLVNRVGPAREYYRAPIDECYKLVGLIRGNWRGLSGGAEVWKTIAEFFRELREKSASRK